MGLLLDDFQAAFRGCSPSEGQWRGISQHARTEVYQALVRKHGAPALTRHLGEVVKVLDTAEADMRSVMRCWANYLKEAQHEPR